MNYGVGFPKFTLHTKDIHHIIWSLEEYLSKLPLRDRLDFINKCSWSSWYVQNVLSNNIYNWSDRQLDEILQEDIYKVNDYFKQKVKVIIVAM